MTKKRTQPPAAVMKVAKRIWFAVRNQVRGTHLNSHAYEQLIAEEVERATEPFRARADRCGRDRRQAVELLADAAGVISKMRKLLRSVGNPKYPPTDAMLKDCLMLGNQDYSRFKMPVD